MADPFVGEIMAIGFNFSPRDWAQCNGAVVPIGQNQVLYAIIGPLYGGDGFSTMALPKLNGRLPVGTGQGPGLSYYNLASEHGQALVYLTEDHLPAHSHGPINTESPPTTGDPAGGDRLVGFMKNANAVLRAYKPLSTAQDKGTMSPSALSSAGLGQAHLNDQPFLALNFIIALDGVFPPRN